MLMTLRVFASRIETPGTADTRPPPLSTSYAEELRGMNAAAALEDREFAFLMLSVPALLVAVLRGRDGAVKFETRDVTLIILSVSAS